MSFEPISAAYRTASTISRALPAPVVEGLGRVASWGAMHISKERRLLVERHLRRARPELRGVALDRATLETFRLYSRYWIESFRLRDIDPPAIDARFAYEGYGNILDGLRRGKGVVLALPHLGGWEWAGFWMSRVANEPITVVVESVEPPELLEFMVGFRAELGMNIVVLGPDAGPTVLRALKANQVVCLLVDRDIEGTGVPVEFFGEPTTMPSGPALMALRAGATLLTGAIYFDGDGHRAVIEGPIAAEREGRMRDDVARVTQDVARRLEALIARAPDQWHLQQPNWPSDFDALDAIGKPQPRPAAFSNLPAARVDAPEDR